MCIIIMHVCKRCCDDKTHASQNRNYVNENTFTLGANFQVELKVSKEIPNAFNKLVKKFLYIYR